MRVFLGDQSVEITKVFILYLRRRTCGELCVEVWPRQASVFACVVLTGIREGLVSPRSSSVNSL